MNCGSKRTNDSLLITKLYTKLQGGPPEFGNAMSHALAMSCGQFRVRDLRDPASGELGLMLELEVRSPRHISCPLPR